MSSEFYDSKFKATSTVPVSVFFLTRAGSEETQETRLKLNYFIRNTLTRVVRPNL